MSTVYGAMITLGILSMVSLLAFGSAMLGHKEQASTAADLAALSAAMVVQTGEGEPCDTARSIAGANGADVESCEVKGEFVTVDVTTRMGSNSRILPQKAQATAGPAE